MTFASHCFTFASGSCFTNGLTALVNRDNLIVCIGLLLASFINASIAVLITRSADRLARADERRKEKTRIA